MSTFSMTEAPGGINCQGYSCSDVQWLQYQSHVRSGKNRSLNRWGTAKSMTKAAEAWHALTAAASILTMVLELSTGGSAAVASVWLRPSSL